MEQEIRPEISDTYSAKGENLRTLEQIFSGQNAAVEEGQHFTRYAFSFQVVFPIIVMFFLGWLSIHLVENDTNGFFKKIRNNYQRPYTEVDVQLHAEGGDSQETNLHDIQNIAVSSRNMHILILGICSVTFVVYVLVLDMIAVSYRHLRVVEKIFYIPFSPTRNESDYGEALELFRLEYAIPILMLCYDIVIFIGMIVFLVYRRCGAIPLKWYHVGFAPASCVVVHSFHIIVAFIHTPQHATSILIFYAISILVFYVTLKTAYYNLFQLYHSDSRANDRWKRFWTLESCAKKI